jgi:hypothetical protein
MEACYGGTDVMERSCAVARGIDINTLQLLTRMCVHGSRVHTQHGDTYQHKGPFDFLTPSVGEPPPPPAARNR